MPRGRGGQGNKGRSSGGNRGRSSGGNKGGGTSSGRRGGQGNRGRKSGSGNKGYGPGSGRGFSGAGIGGNVGGKNRGGGLTNKSGQLSFKGLRDMVGGFFSNPANAMGDITGQLSKLNTPSDWKVKQFADKNIDITKLNPSFRVNIDINRALQGIENDSVRGWLSKHLPKTVKDLKINHQMYSPTKIKPTDPNYNQTGTGSIKLDPETERYLEWVARQNPQGYTISDYEKVYARALKNGFTLQAAMKLNPANTVPYSALIDDKTPDDTSLNTTTSNNESTTNNNNNTTNDMATFDYADKTKRQALIDDIYTKTIGRGAVLSRGDTPNTIEGDADYWDNLIAGGSFGNTEADIRAELGRHLQGGSEFKNRLKFVDDYRAANAGADPTEAMIDAAVGPGGVLYNTAANPHTNIADQRTTNEWLQNYGVGDNYSIQSQDPLLSAINESTAIANTEGTVPGFLKTSNPDYTKANMDAATTAGIQSGMDEAAKTWYAQKYGAYDSQEAYDAANPATNTNTGTGGMDDFMKFMMMLAIMPRGGGGGGYGGGQYGYGGMSPGGVQAAYNPWQNVQTGWDFMKNNFGSGSGSGASTATVNAT